MKGFKEKTKGEVCNGGVWLTLLTPTDLAWWTKDPLCSFGSTQCASISWEVHLPETFEPISKKLLGLLPFYRKHGGYRNKLSDSTRKQTHRFRMESILLSSGLCFLTPGVHCANEGRKQHRTKYSAWIPIRQTHGKGGARLETIGRYL